MTEISARIAKIKKDLGHIKTSNNKTLMVGERIQVKLASITKFNPKFDAKTGRRYFSIICDSSEYGTLWLATSKDFYHVGGKISFSANVKGEGTGLLFLSRARILEHIEPETTIIDPTLIYDSSR